MDERERTLHLLLASLNGMRNELIQLGIDVGEGKYYGGYFARDYFTPFSHGVEIGASDMFDVIINEIEKQKEEMEG